MLSNAQLTLVLGGARSGKSAFAERLVMQTPPPWVYVATAQAFDDEMRTRIEAHRAWRAPGWTTVEAPLDLEAALDGAGVAGVLIDCLTLWLTNVILRDEADTDRTEGLIAAIGRRQSQTVLVANEVGLGIVPDNALARRFRDQAGGLHQRLASMADRVVLMVAGLPVAVKE